jgi:glycosyltransferase involved in cell wall biosynthesis
MLQELLAALDGQTYRSFEVVVIDDGSRDGSGDLARASRVADQPVRGTLLTPSGNRECSRISPRLH